MTLDFLAMGIAGFGWGALSDRFGPRRVVLAGSVLLGLGLALASRATSQTGFRLPTASSSASPPAASSRPCSRRSWDGSTRHRSLAVSLVSVGIGVAPMTLSPFAAWLVSHTDWRTAQLTIAILVWVLLTPAALFVRRRRRQRGVPGGAGAPAAEPRLASALPCVRRSS